MHALSHKNERSQPLLEPVSGHIPLRQNIVEIER
jgi:hypothetical protein